MASLTSPFNAADLSHHESKVTTIVGLNAALMAVTIAAVSARVFSRLKFVRNMFRDDYLIIFAAACTLAFSAVCVVATRSGLGRHEWDLNLPTVIVQSVHIVKLLFVCQVLYATAITFTKLSIITLYLRIFPHQRIRILMQVTAALIIAMWVCSVFVTIFQCNPIRGAWDFTLQNKHCISILDYFYVSSSVNIATDLVLCTAPLPLIWKLRVSRKERNIICVLFAVGLFATAASAVRLSQLHYLSSSDISYVSVSSLNWSVIEVVSGIVCASVPSLKPLVKHFFPGSWSVLNNTADSRLNTWEAPISWTSPPLRAEGDVEMAEPAPAYRSPRHKMIVIKSSEQSSFDSDVK